MSVLVWVARQNPGSIQSSSRVTLPPELFVCSSTSEHIGTIGGSSKEQPSQGMSQPSQKTSKGSSDCNKTNPSGRRSRG